MRLKGVIVHGHDTKLPGEDGEDTAVGWGTRLNLKAKPFEEDPEDALTRNWGNRPNPRKDPTPAYGWGNRPNPKKESHIRQHRKQSRPRKVYTHPTADEHQTRGHWYTTDEYSYSRRGAANGGQTDSYMYSTSG